VAGTRTLSESESAELVARYGVPVAPWRRAASVAEAVAAAGAVGYPVVVKLHAEGLAHKSEQRLVRLGLAGPEAVATAAEELLVRAGEAGGSDAGQPGVRPDLLVARMAQGARELVAGLHTDPQFGRCVMVGLGGVLTEALGDVVIRLVPLDAADAHDALDELHAQALLDEWRGEPAVDRDAVADVLLALARLAEAEPDVVSVDLNPLVVEHGRPVAVDALVETRVS
jgi:succinyl-CoA synthetase beta subunit